MKTIKYKDFIPYDEDALGQKHLFDEIRSLDAAAEIPLLSEWLDTNTAPVFDDQYTYAHSGNKPISLWLERFADNTGNKIDNNKVAKVAKHIYTRYAANWSRMYNAYMAEYEPLDNYNGIEETEYDNTDTNTHTPAEDRKIKTETTVKTDTTVTTDTDTYGFNSSSSGVPTGKATTHAQGNPSDNVTKVEQQEVGQLVDEMAHDGKVTIKKHGNLGVTTSQQMIESEMQLRKGSFIEYIFQSLDELLTARFYTSERR